MIEADRWPVLRVMFQKGRNTRGSSYAENTSAPGWSVFAFLYDQCGAKTLPLRAQAVRVSEGSRGRIIATGRVKEPSNGRRRGDQLVRHLCNNIGTTDHLGLGSAEASVTCSRPT
jgi:hypothetical protein